MKCGGRVKLRSHDPNIDLISFSAFYISDVLQVCRGLVIAAIVFGFVAVFVTVMGLKCVTMGGKNAILKARVAMTGGLMFGVTG